MLDALAAIAGILSGIAMIFGAMRAIWRWRKRRRRTNITTQEVQQDHGEVLCLAFDKNSTPVGSRSVVSLFLNDLSRIHGRKGVLPLFEITVEGCTAVRKELEQLEDHLSNDPNMQARRFELRRAVDDKRVGGGLPVDLYLTEAVSIAARQLSPGRLVWISTHEQYVDAFMRFLSLLSNGWPQPSDPFDIFPAQGAGIWYARMYLTNQDVQLILDTQNCPSVHHLTRNWGLRIMDCPMDVVQRCIIPGLLQSYLLWKNNWPEKLPSEDEYFRNMSNYGVGLH